MQGKRHNLGQPCRAHAAEWDEEGALSTEAAEPAEERDMEAEEGGFFCENGIGLFSMEGIVGSVWYGHQISARNGFTVNFSYWAGEEPGFVGRGT